MGFAKNKTTTSETETTKPKAVYRTIASVWESKNFEGQFSIRVSEDRTSPNGKSFKAPGTLMYQDNETGKLYQVKNIYMFEPKTQTRGLVYNLSLNLANPKSAVVMGETSSPEDSSVELDSEDTE